MMKKPTNPFRYFIIKYGYSAYAIIIAAISSVTIVESYVLINKTKEYIDSHHMDNQQIAQYIFQGSALAIIITIFSILIYSIFKKDQD